MNSNLMLSLTALVLASTAALADTGGYSAGFSGSFDESEKSTFQRPEVLEFRREEFLSFSFEAEDPFPETPIQPIDPLSKKRMNRVLVGPAIKIRGYGSNYDYYRYVTYYNVKNKKERIYELPIHREECTDKAEVFASYNYSYSYSASVSASASIEGLGLSGSISDSRSYSTSRNLRATGGIIAEHIPYFSKQSWTGRTFIQLIDSKTKRSEILLKDRIITSWWAELFFPIIVDDYPMAFSVKNADWVFMIDRKVISSCHNGFEG